MEVVLYARVGTDNNQDLEPQLYMMRQFCRDVRWKIGREYVDIASAGDYAGRKQWQQLKEAAHQREFKAVLVLRIDRAFRNVQECINCLEDWRQLDIAFKSIQGDVFETSTGQS